MPRQGLTAERVVEEAVALIEERGLVRFSMGELARRLHVRPASLYNHVESADRLKELVGKEAVRRLVEAEEAAVRGREGDEALFALAEAYRAFAREHSRLYGVIMAFPRWEDPELDLQAERAIAPILRVLSGYGLAPERQRHWQRVLRGLMAGFAFHEQAGGFAHYPEDRDESFRIALECVAEGLRREGEGKE